MIDIRGLDKARLAEALYNVSKEHLEVNLLPGVEEYDETAYDLLNGFGAAAMVVKTLRAQAVSEAAKKGFEGA